MRNLLKFSSLALMVMVLMTACETDPGPTPSDDPPSVSFVSEAGFLDTDADLTAGEEFKVKISAVSGTAALKTLTVFEDGAKLDTDRFDVNGDPAAANPLLVVDADDKNSFIWTVTVRAQDSGTVNYEFEVEDDGGLSSSASIVISIGANEPPKLTFEGDGMFMTSPASLVSIVITGEVGGAALSTIGVYEDGFLISDVSRLRIDDATNEFTANPNAIAEGSKDGFTTNLYIRSHEGSGALPYTVELTDESGNTASFDITISSGTPVIEFTAVLVSNADGPNQGGLDLDAGTSVPAASADAELRDLGIDINQGAATNWIQQIESVNGAQLRLPDASQPETFKYENITSVEAIQAAFDAGTTVATSPTVEVGDVFLVSSASGGKVWILEVAEVNIKETDNTDNYVFNIKGE